MPLTRNGAALDGVTLGGNALSAVQYNGTEVWSAGGGSTPSTFEFTMPSDALTLNLYLTQSAANAVTVDWGDSTQADNPSGTTPSLSHTYAAAGDYTVTISCVSGETWYPGTSFNAFTGSMTTTRNNLTGFVFGDGATSVTKGAFQREGSLVSAVLTDVVTVIGQSAFSSCAALASIHIGTGVTEFGNLAFATCTGLQNIYLKDIPAYCAIAQPSSSQSNAEPFAAGGKTKLKNLYLNDVLQTELHIPSSVSKVPKWRFAKLGSVKNLEIAAKELQNIAFRYSTNLEKVWIRGTVETIIADSATNGPFADCSSSMQIYCEANEAPAGWGQYWNYVGSGSAITPVWGQTTRPW